MGILAIGAAVVTVAIVIARSPSDPVEVIQTWDDARNAGDVDAALALVAEDATILGFNLISPTQRDALRTVLEAQVIAGWHGTDAGCAVEGVTISCRYTMDDEILRRWSAAFTGVHEFTIRDGSIEAISRRHDPEVRDRIYAAALDLREWVRSTHPELYRVIWADVTSTFYTAPDGARALLDIIDEYPPPAL